MVLNREIGTITGANYTIRHLPTFFKNADFKVFFNKHRPFLVIVFETRRGVIKHIKKEYFESCYLAAKGLRLNEFEVIHVESFYKTVLNDRLQ